MSIAIDMYIHTKNCWFILYRYEDEHLLPVNNLRYILNKKITYTVYNI